MTSLCKPFTHIIKVTFLLIRDVNKYCCSIKQQQRGYAAFMSDGRWKWKLHCFLSLTVTHIAPPLPVRSTIAMKAKISQTTKGTWWSLVEWLFLSLCLQWWLQLLSVSLTNNSLLSCLQEFLWFNCRVHIMFMFVFDTDEIYYELLCKDGKVFFLWSAMVASTVELVFSALLSRMSLMSLSLFRYRRSHHARLRLWRGAHLAVP